MKRWLPGLILIVLVAFLAACTPQSAGSPTATPTPSPTPTASPGGSSEVHTVTIQEVKDKLDKGEKLVLIDVRSQSQFTAGHLQGARNIPEGELVARSLDFPLDSQVIVYASCLWAGDDTGARAVRTLQAKGFTNVKEMQGGFAAWEKAGYPVQSSY